MKAWCFANNNSGTNVPLFPAVRNIPPYQHKGR